MIKYGYLIYGMQLIKELCIYSGSMLSFFMWFTVQLKSMQFEVRQNPNLLMPASHCPEVDSRWTPRYAQKYNNNKKKLINQ